MQQEQQEYPGLGHNNPPEITEIMAQEQSELYADKLKEIDQRVQKEAEVPPAIVDDETAGKASDFIKLAKATIKESENIRLAEKKKYTVKSDAIQAFWKKRLGPLELAMKRVEEKLAPYLKEKEDRKRREAEEKARIAAEKAAAMLKAAQEKEREEREAKERAEAEVKRLEAEREKREAEAKAEAERKRKEAEARAQAEREKAAAELKAKQDEIDRLNKEKAEAERLAAEKVLQDEADQKAAEELRERERKAAEELKAAQKNVKTAEKTAGQIVKDTEKEIRSDHKEMRAEMADAENELSEINREVKDATRDKNRLMDQAVRADKEATRAEKHTLAGSAALSRTRGDGSVASVTEKWTADVVSRDELLYSAAEIWEHIPFEALEQAGRSWVRANENNRSLRGLLVYQETKTGVR